MPVRLGIQIANVKLRQIWSPRVGNQIWVVHRDAHRIWGFCWGVSSSTPQKPNLPGDESVSLFFRFTIVLEGSVGFNLP